MWARLGQVRRRDRSRRLGWRLPAVRRCVPLVAPCAVVGRRRKRGPSYARLSSAAAEGTPGCCGPRPDSPRGAFAISPSSARSEREYGGRRDDTTRPRQAVASRPELVSRLSPFRPRAKSSNFACLPGPRSRPTVTIGFAVGHAGHGVPYSASCYNPARRSQACERVDFDLPGPCMGDGRC